MRTRAIRFTPSAIFCPRHSFSLPFLVLAFGIHLYCAPFVASIVIISTSHPPLRAVPHTQVLCDITRCCSPNPLLLHVLKQREMKSQLYFACVGSRHNASITTIRRLSLLYYKTFNYVTSRNPSRMRISALSQFVFRCRHSPARLLFSQGYHEAECDLKFVWPTLSNLLLLSQCVRVVLELDKH